MKIKVTKKAEFEVEFFAESMMKKDDWGFVLPTICIGLQDNVLRICAFFAFWCAGVDIRKVKPELND